MKPSGVVAAVAAGMLALGGCSGSSDPYYEALADAGWSGGPLSEAENADLYEAMAVEVCGEVRDMLAAGADEADVVSRALAMIDGSDPTSAAATGALDALLDHRCDAGQPDGLKARA